MNQRPPGYEPDELPTALSRDIKHFSECLNIIYHPLRKINPFLKIFFVSAIPLFFCRPGGGEAGLLSAKTEPFWRQIRQGRSDEKKRRARAGNAIRRTFCRPGGGEAGLLSAYAGPFWRHIRRGRSDGKRGVRGGAAPFAVPFRRKNKSVFAFSVGVCYTDTENNGNGRKRI